MRKKFKIIFLDRDGVINQNPARGDYVKNWSEFKFLPGAVKAIRLLNEKGFSVFVVTNQRGIARGLMTEKDLNEIHRKLREELRKEGAKLDGIYCCPHQIGECDCRKPKPGLFFQAAKDHHLDLSESIFIGNSRSDLQAGKAAGCETILMRTNGNLSAVVEKILKNV